MITVSTQTLPASWKWNGDACVLAVLLYFLPFGTGLPRKEVWETWGNSSALKHKQSKNVGELMTTGPPSAMNRRQIIDAFPIFHPLGSFEMIFMRLLRMSSGMVMQAPQVIGNQEVLLTGFFCFHVQSISKVIPAHNLVSGSALEKPRLRQCLPKSLPLIQHTGKRLNTAKLRQSLMFHLASA